MFLSEEQVNDLVEKFMPRVRVESVAAMKDVACHGLSILASASKHKITHQSLSKNLSRLKELQNKIADVEKTLSGSFLLEQIATALQMAPTNISFTDAKHVLIKFCEEHGGRVELGYPDEEIKLYLDNTTTCVFNNPDESYEYEWSFDQNESE